MSVDTYHCPGYLGPWHELSVWFSLYSDYHRSAASPSGSLRCFPSIPTNFTRCRISPLLQPPNTWAQVWSCWLSSSFSLPSFVLPNYTWVHIILSSGQGLLPVFSQCSVRAVVSVHVFLMHLWGEIRSTSTYVSTTVSEVASVMSDSLQPSEP